MRLTRKVSVRGKELAQHTAEGEWKAKEVTLKGSQKMSDNTEEGRIQER